MSKEEQTSADKAAGELTAEIPQTGEDSKSSGGIGSIPLQGYTPRVKQQQAESASRSTKRKRESRPPVGRRQKSVKRPWYVIVLFFFAALVATYAVAAFFLVPTFVKGPIAERISRLTDHSVSVNHVLFSPFTLNLRVSEIVLSRAGKENRQDTLLSCSRIELNMSLISLLTQKSLLDSLIIDKMVLNLIRYEGMDFNVSRLQKELITGHPELEAVRTYTWLIPGQVDVFDSQIIFDDKPAGKQHKIEHINFRLPPASGSIQAEARIPKLTAVVNSSPVQVSVKRVETDKGELETHLSLYSKQINLPEYLDYMPQFSEKLYFAGGTGEVHFDLIFAVNDAGRKDFMLKGSASLTEVLLNRVDKTPLLKIPSILISLKTNPLKRQVEIEDVILREPELYLAVETHAPKKDKKLDMSGGAVSAFLNALPLSLKIDRLMVDNGLVMFGSISDKKIKNTNWQNIHFSLTGFANRNYVETTKTVSKPAAFQLSGISRSGKRSMSGAVQGALSSSLEAEGRITVKDVDLVKYQSLFLLTDRYHVIDGQISLDSMFTYQPESSVETHEKAKGLHLYDGNAALRNYTVLDGRERFFSGKSFSCNEMDINYLEKKFYCDRLDADENEIFPDFWEHGFLKKQTVKNKIWQLSFNDLDVQDSIFHINVSLPDNEMDNKTITLTEVSLKASGLQQSRHVKANVAGLAKIAGKGELRISGIVSQADGTGNLQTAFKDVDLVLFRPFYASWLIPDVLKGSLHGSGMFEMGVKRFKGNIWIDDFATGWEKEPVVSWKKASATDAVFTLNPLHLGIDEVLIQQPVIHFPSRKRVGAVQYFYPLKREVGKSVNISKVDIQKIAINDGQCSFADAMIADGFLPKMTNINGELSAIHSNTPVTFNLKGLLNDTISFTVEGITDLFGINTYELHVEKLPLISLGQQLRDTIGSASENSTVSFQQIMKAADSGREFSDTVVLQGLQPKQGTSFANVFSLLIDEKEQVVFSFVRQQNDENSAPLFDEIILRLKRDTVKASLSPELVLKSFFSELNLVENVWFDAGTSQPVDLRTLNDYVILLGKRPWLKLVLSGSYEADKDAEALQRILQNRAESQRDLENRRRMEEKKKNEELQQEKLKAISKDSEKIIVEKMGPEELNKELDPLPPTSKVSLPDRALNILGAERLELVRSYFDNELGLDADRIELSADIQEKGAAVLLQLQPVFQ